MTGLVTLNVILLVLADGIRNKKLPVMINLTIGKLLDTVTEVRFIPIITS